MIVCHFFLLLLVCDGYFLHKELFFNAAKKTAALTTPSTLMYGVKGDSFASRTCHEDNQTLGQDLGTPPRCRRKPVSTGRDKHIICDTLQALLGVTRDRPGEEEPMASRGVSWCLCFLCKSNRHA